MVLAPRFCEYTTCTAVDPKAVRTVRIYGLMKINLTAHPETHPLSAHFPPVVAMNLLVYVSICNTSQQKGPSRVSRAAGARADSLEPIPFEPTNSYVLARTVMSSDFLDSESIDFLDSESS